MSENEVAIHWFRQDLRLADNPALTLAAQHRSVLAIYIVDDVNAGNYPMGAASRWWLHHSLAALNDSLQDKLALYAGNPIDIFAGLISRLQLAAVYWNRCYEPWQISRDTKIKAYLKAKGIAVNSANGSLLCEPWQVTRNDATPYKVFTPFYNKLAFQAELSRQPLPVPANLNCITDSHHALQLDDLSLLPEPSKNKKLAAHWRAGEREAWQCWQEFSAAKLAGYDSDRDFPAKDGVSKLSAPLHFGEISPNQIWHTARTLSSSGCASFCRQLGWREFCYNLLYYHPELPFRNLRPKFDKFAWRDDAALLQAWQAGLTGVPLVDAGMRQLLETGYIHNRVRMVVASFLVKNLRLHWHNGARWFWDNLVDADLANNSAGWQWVAGCGTDAAPYFRIFNPVSQAQKFDPEGNYIRRFVPELALLPDKYLSSPWQAAPATLKLAKVELGSCYPAPVVDLKQSRHDALAAFQELSLPSE